MIILSCSCLIGVSVCLLFRNQRIYTFRGELLDCIKPGTPEFRHLMDEYDSVPYDKILISFKSPSSFYQGTDLIRLWGES